MLVAKDLFRNLKEHQAQQERLPQVLTKLKPY